MTLEVKDIIAAVSCIASFVALSFALFQYGGRYRGRIKIFCAIPTRMNGFNFPEDPETYISIKLVNATHMERLVTNVYFQYDNLLSDLGLVKVLSYPIVLQPMRGFEILLPFRSLLALKEENNLVNHKFDDEGVLEVFAIDSTGQRYKRSALIFYNLEKVNIIQMPLGGFLNRANTLFSINLSKFLKKKERNRVWRVIFKLFPILLFATLVIMFVILLVLASTSPLFQFNFKS